MKIDQQDDNDDKEENPLSMMIISEESNSQMVPSVFSKSMTEKKISKDNFLLSVSLSLSRFAQRLNSWQKMINRIQCASYPKGGTSQLVTDIDARVY